MAGLATKISTMAKLRWKLFYILSLIVVTAIIVIFGFLPFEVKKIISTNERYIYLVIVIVMIRLILGIAKIIDMKPEGFIGSALTGIVLLFLLEIIDYFRKRYNDNNKEKIENKNKSKNISRQQGL